MENWNDLCKAATVENTECSTTESFVSGLSFLKMFGIDDLEAATESEIQIAWQRFISNPTLFNNLKLLYTPKEQFIGTGNVTYMRSFLNFGAPLEINGVRYNDATDRTDEQRVVVADHHRAINVFLKEQQAESDQEGVSAQIFSEEVLQQEFDILVKNDTGYAVFSVLFVFIYFIFHLRSLFLSSIGISIILFSFGVTAIVCEGIFRVTYYSNLHSLVIFIVLGIAADDIFVFIDAWRQSRFIKEFDTKQRMSYAWKRAVRAMAVTSSTTSVAFLANSFSPIMPIKAFGIYAAIIIPANYLLVVFIFPPCVIFYEKHFENKCNPLCCKNKVEEDEIMKIQPI